MSNPTQKDAGQSHVVAFIQIELRDDHQVLVSTNLRDKPLVFSRLMGDALTIMMNDLMTESARRVELAEIANGGRKLNLMPPKEN